jgi:hypothetical protein
MGSRNCHFKRIIIFHAKLPVPCEISQLYEIPNCVGISWKYGISNCCLKYVSTIQYIRIYIYLFNKSEFKIKTKLCKKYHLQIHFISIIFGSFQPSLRIMAATSLHMAPAPAQPAQSAWSVTKQINAHAKAAQW